MQKVGLFFGSFNPIHTGHLIIANYMANYTDLSEVWFVVSPHNPLKKKDSLLNKYHRLEMVNLALEEANNIRASDIEFGLPQPSYTIDTLIHLQGRYPNIEFVLIMGSDNLLTLKRWKNYEIILRDFAIYVYPRPNHEITEWSTHPKVTITNTPLMEISSTFIRNALKEGKDVHYFLPEKVLAFIDKAGVYR